MSDAPATTRWQRLPTGRAGEGASGARQGLGRAEASEARQGRGCERGAARAGEAHVLRPRVGKRVGPCQDAVIKQAVLGRSLPAPSARSLALAAPRSLALAAPRSHPRPLALSPLPRLARRPHLVHPPDAPQPAD